MIKVSVWTVCLFSALTVGMKSLSQTGRVGGNVTFYCSGWEGFRWNDVKSYDKYICNNPCKDDKHVIMRVKPGKTQRKDRICLYNNGGTLSVTFTDLQKSDSKIYYCGLERFLVKDPLIKLNLEVIDAVTSPPKTTVRTVSVWSNSTVSSSSSDITSDISTLFTTLQSTASAASQTHGDYSRVIYLTTGFTFVITTLLLLLCLMMKMKKGRKKKVLKPGSPETVIQQDVDYAEITHEDHAERSPAGVHMETLYANCSSHQDTDCIYSVAKTPEEQPEPNKQTVTNDPESSTVYSIYCLAEQTQVK